MRRPSVADHSIAGDRARIAAMTADERIHLCLELGRRDLALYASAHGLDVPTARRAVERRRQARRLASACMQALLG